MRAEKPHAGASGRALHEQDHGVLGDRLLDRVAKWVGGLIAHRASSASAVLVLNGEGVDAVAELGAEHVVDEPVLGDPRQAAERGRR